MAGFCYLPGCVICVFMFFFLSCFGLCRRNSVDENEKRVQSLIVADTSMC